MLQNLRIGWIGFHQEGVPALRGLVESGIRLEAIITLAEPQMQKRSAGVRYHEILQSSGIPVYPVSSVNDESTVELLRSLQLDLLLVIGWSQILSAETLATARLGAIGAHASLLPHNRGSAPINWAIIRGESQTGNSLIWLTPEVDEGRLIDQIAFPISPWDTCATLYDKVAETNRDMILRLLPRLFAGENPGKPQQHLNEPLLPRRRPADGKICWDHSAAQVYNFIRALTRPYPGAFSFLDGHHWILQACAVLPDVPGASGRPGTVVGPVFSPIEAACGQMIRCGQGAIVALELEDLDGRILRGRELSSADWTGKVWTNE